MKANVTELARPGVAHMYHDYPEADVNTLLPGDYLDPDLRLPRLQVLALRGEEGRARARRPRAQGVTR